MQLDAYEVAYNLAKKDDVDMLQFGYGNLQEGNNIRVVKSKCKEEMTLDRDVFLMQHATGHVWNKLYKFNLIKEANVKFIEGMKLSQDVFFTMMVQAKAQKVKVIPNTLYVYRINENSATHKFPRETYQERQIYYNCIGFNLVFDYYKMFGYARNHEHILLSWAIKQITHFRPTMLMYAQEILDSFDSDIYNAETVKKCDEQTQKLIRELEYAAHPEKFQSGAGEKILPKNLKYIDSNEKVTA